MPTGKVIEEGDVFILDTAPVLNGTPADIGLAFCLGENQEFKKSMNFFDKVEKENSTIVRVKLR